MVANPDRAIIHANLDKLVPQLPPEVTELFKYWTPEGYQPQLLSDWQLLVLRLLWYRGVTSGSGGNVDFDYQQLADVIASAMSRSLPKIYEPGLERISNVFTLSVSQSLTIHNTGSANGTITANSKTRDIKPNETLSWSPSEDNILCEVVIDGTGTSLVVTYLEELATKNTLINPSNFVATAFNEDVPPSNVFDGNPETVWESNGEQQPEQWFRFDMRKVQQLSRIEIEYDENDNTNGDYARSLKVSGSNDGVTWTELKTVQGSVVTTVDLGTVNYRFIELTNQEFVAGIWWVIREIRVFN